MFVAKRINGKNYNGNLVEYVAEPIAFSMHFFSIRNFSKELYKKFHLPHSLVKEK